MQRGEFCYVLTSRQMGKSSLMVHTAARLREEGVAVAVLDLTAVGQNLSAEQWYGGLLRRLGRQLDPEGDLEEALEEYWFEREARVGPLERWMEALQQIILPQVAGRIVIFIDEIDAVRSLRFSTDEFFAAIRECYNRRAQDLAFERLTFCLLGVATPSDLIQDTRTTPFNIGTRIELTDFTAAEAAPLAAGLGVRSSVFGVRTEPALPNTEHRTPNTERLLHRILYWTGGHPYLTQRLCQAVAEALRDEGRGMRDEETTIPSHPSSLIPHPSELVDRLCEALFLSAEARERDDNLLFVRERLLRQAGPSGPEADLASLLDLYGRVRAGRRVGVDDTNPLIDLLRLSGVARAEDGRLRVRNRIYERAFDREWVTQHMPDAELRRQKAAFRRGMWRTAAVAGVVVAGMASLTVVALRQRQMARAAAAKERAARRWGQRLLYDADMQLSSQIWASEQGTAQAVQELLAAHWPQPGEEDRRGFEWRYQWTLLNHGAPVFRTAGPPAAIAVTDNGSLIAVDAERQLWAWDRTSRTAPRHLDLRTAWGASQVALAPDGRTVAVSARDGTVALLDPATGREQRALEPPGSLLLPQRFLGDGRTLLTRDQTGTSWVWDVGAPPVRRLPGGAPVTLKESIPEAQPRGFWVDPLSSDGQTLARLNFPLDGQISLLHWHAPRRERLLFRGGVGTIQAAAFSPDGKLLAASPLGSPVVLWDVSTGKMLARLHGARARVGCLAFSPDGKLLAAGSYDGEVCLWSAQVTSGQPAAGEPPRREQRRLKGQTRAITQLSFSANGRWLVSAADDGTLRRWDLPSSGDVHTLIRLSTPIVPIAYSPDGRWLAVGSRDGMARLYEATTGRMVRLLRVSAGTKMPGIIADKVNGVKRLAFSPDGRLLATGDADTRVTLWDVSTGRALDSFVGPLHHSGSPVQGVGALAFSPDGKLLAAGFGNPDWFGSDYDQEIKLWDVAAARELPPLKGLRNTVGSLAFSPDGKLLAAAGYDHAVKLWATQPWKLIRTLPFDAWVTSLARSPDGRMLAAGNTQGRILIWDLPTGRVLHQISAHAFTVSGLDFSPDGRTLASGSWDGMLKLWDPATGRDLSVLAAGSEPVVSVTFSPSADALALGAASFDTTPRVDHPAGGDGTVRLWPAAPLEKIAAAVNEERQAARQAERKQQEAAARSALLPVAGGSEAAVQLQWRPWPEAVGYDLYRGAASGGAAALTPLNSQPMAGTSFTDRRPGLVNGRPVTYAIAPLLRQRGRLIPAARIVFYAIPAAAPPGWTGTSINEGPWSSGAVISRPGDPQLTLRGSGADFWNAADGGYFLNQPLTGDFQITVKALTRLAMTHPWAKAGLMIRESLSPAARDAFLVATPLNGLVFQWRGKADQAAVDEFQNGSAVIIQPAALRPPVTLRLARRGNTITAEYSLNDGRSFHPAGRPLTFQQALPQTLYAGLAITAHDESQVSEAKFRDLRIERG